MYNTIGMALESMNALFALKESVHVPIDVILSHIDSFNYLFRIMVARCGDFLRHNTLKRFIENFANGLLMKKCQKIIYHKKQNLVTFH